MAATDSIPVLWSAALFNRSGYSEEARENVLGLANAGIPVLADPLHLVGWQKPLAPGDADRLESLVMLEEPERFVHVMHYGAAHYERRPGAVRRIGRTMWETDRLPPNWVVRCNELDDVWVPSAFNVATFAHAGVASERLHVVPEGVRRDVYGPDLAPFDLPDVTGFVFLSVFSWSRRKGWDVLLRAYLDEFSPDDDVTLLLLVTPFSKPVAEHLQELEAFIRIQLGRDPARSAPILILDVEPGTMGMPRLYRAAHAYVQPSRAEGWGRPLMEAMACGRPTIGTRWSGNLHFMNDDNSYLVDCDLVPVSEDAWREWPWFRGQRWAEPSTAHLRTLLRRVVERPDEARAKGERARETIFGRFTSEHVAAAVVERLEALGIDGPTVPRPPPRPEGARAWTELAERLLADERPRDAAGCARRALSLAPADPDAYALLASAFAALELTTLAVRARDLAAVHVAR
ncbi:MAG: glycosyltransferase [Gaiellaceae bacterium]